MEPTCSLCVLLFGIIVIFYTAGVILRWLRVGEFRRRSVVITGCDSGFGCLLAKRLDIMGFNVFAGCLTVEGREELARATSRRLDAVLLDVTNESSIRKLVKTVEEQIKRDDQGLWGLVNNAGVAGSVGPAEWMRKDDYLRTFDVNLFGVMETTRQFLPLLRKGHGRIVNMSSANGSFTVPFFVPYTISKYGVEIFSDSLRAEVRGHGVSVHIIKPGMFKTNIRATAPLIQGLERSYEKQSLEVREVYPPGFLSKLTEFASIQPRGSADVGQVVEAYVHALTARFPRYRYRVGLDAKTLLRLLEWMPEFITDFIYCYILQRIHNRLL